MEKTYSVTMSGDQRGERITAENIPNRELAVKQAAYAMDVAQVYVGWSDSWTTDDGGTAWPVWASREAMQDPNDVDPPAVIIEHRVG